MAGALQRCCGNFIKKNCLVKHVKPLSTAIPLLSAEPSKKQSFFQKIWESGISPPTDAHSKALTVNTACYNLQVDSVKPEYMSEYIDETSLMYTKLDADINFPGKLLGSWKTMFGDLDQTFHLWVYKDGYAGASQEIVYIQENKEMQDFIQRKGKWLRSRSSQLCHDFSFWGEPKPRKPSHIYEIRSYDLKPGTLITWGNNWGRAINIRRKDAVGGFFSQVGDLYQVHHIWAYDDLNHRKSERENMWQNPGWDDCVAATVPLVRHMKAQILIPTPYSPMK